MVIEFCPGYVTAPFRTLAANYPERSVYPLDSFRVEWGPVFHRGRLDGSARILVIGQDPAQHEVILRRTMVGAAGKRVQGFLARLGVTRSYVVVNTFLYSVYGQGGGAKHITNGRITRYRNRWLAAILDSSPIEAVVTFGMLADHAWQRWLESSLADGRPPLPYRTCPHPSSPESGGSTPAERAQRTAAMLIKYNEALQALRAAPGHPDKAVAFKPYTDAFTPADLPDIPSFDLPAGTPEWMRQAGKWADREGATPQMKRRKIVITAPADSIV